MTTPPQPAVRYRFVIGAVLLPLQVASGLNFFAPSPLFPQIMAEYGVDRTTVSLMISLVTLMFALFAIPAGLVAARIGLRRAMLIGGLLTAVGLLTPLTKSFPLLMATRMALGLGNALLLPVTGAVVMQWFAQRETPIMNGLTLMGQSLGVSLSFFLTVVIAQAFGAWQAPLAIYGLITLVSAVAWGIFAKSAKGASAVSAVSMREVLKVLPQKNTLLLGFAMMGPFAQYVALSSWLPTFYQEVRGMPPATTSLMTGILPFVGMGATLVGGVLPSRVGLRKPFILIPGTLIGLAGIATFITPNLSITFIGLILLGICSWIFTPTIFTIAMELPGISPQKVGVVLGAAFAMGNFTPFLSPLLVGYMRDTVGSYFPGFMIWAVFSSSLFISALLLPETGPKAKEKLARQATATAPG